MTTTVVGMDAGIPPGSVVLVVDVIRAFTTAAVAFTRGAARSVACRPPTPAGRCAPRIPGSC